MQTISYPPCPPCETLYGDTGRPYPNRNPNSVIGGICEICGLFPPYPISAKTELRPTNQLRFFW